MSSLVSSVKTLLTIMNHGVGYCVACGTGVLIYFILHKQGSKVRLMKSLEI